MVSLQPKKKKNRNVKVWHDICRYMDVKELYVSEGNVIGSTFVLTILENGVPNLTWYMGNSKVEEKNPIISKRYDGSMKIEYGEPNLFGVRQVLCFIDSSGKLENRWEKIK